MYYSKIFKEENNTVFTMWVFPSAQALKVWSGINQVGQGAVYLLRVIKTPTVVRIVLRCGITGVVIDDDLLDINISVSTAFLKAVELMKDEARSENKELTEESISIKLGCIPYYMTKSFNKEDQQCKNLESSLEFNLYKDADDDLSISLNEADSCRLMIKKTCSDFVVHGTLNVIEISFLEKDLDGWNVINTEYYPVDKEQEAFEHFLLKLMEYRDHGTVSSTKEESWSLDAICNHQKTHQFYNQVGTLELDGEIYKDVSFCFIDEDTIQYIHPKRKDVCTTYYKSIVG